VVAYLGSYDPHSKVSQIDKELASRYLSNGAQPSDRVARLLKSEGVKLPDWVKLSEPKKRAIRNPEKLRRNQPKEEMPVAEETAEPAVEEAVESTETPAESPAEETLAEAESSPEPEAPAESPAEPEAPAETPASE
jgi:small subunit ribosomal protein S16